MLKHRQVIAVKQSKDRFCKTIASVAFVDTSIPSDLRLKTMNFSEPVIQVSDSGLRVFVPGE